MTVPPYLYPTPRSAAVRRGLLFSPCGSLSTSTPGGGGKKLGRSSVDRQSSHPPDSQCLSVEVSKGALLFTYSQRPQKEVGPLGTGNPLPPPPPATPHFFLLPHSIPSLFYSSLIRMRQKDDERAKGARQRQSAPE